MKYNAYLEDMREKKRQKVAMTQKYRQDLLDQIKSKEKEKELRWASNHKPPTTSEQQILFAEKQQRRLQENTFFTKAKVEQDQLKEERLRLESQQRKQEVFAMKSTELSRIRSEKEHTKQSSLNKQRKLQEQRMAIQSVAERRIQRAIESREAAEKHIEIEILRQEQSLSEDIKRKNSLIENTCKQFIKLTDQRMRGTKTAEKLHISPSTQLYRQTLDLQVADKLKLRDMKRFKDQMEGHEIKLKADEEIREARIKQRRKHAKSLEIRDDLNKQVKEKHGRLLNGSRLNSRELSFQRSWIESLQAKPAARSPLDSSNFF